MYPSDSEPIFGPFLYHEGQDREEVLDVGGTAEGKDVYFHYPRELKMQCFIIWKSQLDYIKTSNSTFTLRPTAS